MRNYEEVLQRLETNKEYHSFFLSLLEKVEIKRKKDGTHFQNINQTFVNAEYMNIAYPELRFCGRNKYGKWETYTIYCYLYADEMAKDDVRKEKAVSTGSWTRDIYRLTTDEIIERIEEEKENQKRQIESYDRQIAKSKVVFEEVEKKVIFLRDFIKESTKSLKEPDRYGKPIFSSSLEYALFEYAKDNIR